MANQQQERTQGQGQGQFGPGHGEFKVQIEYKTPHDGVWNRQMVRIAALGNMDGFSPANLIQAKGENQRIVSIEEVRDLTINPATAEELIDLLDPTRQQQTYRR